MEATVVMSIHKFPVADIEIIGIFITQVSLVQIIGEIDLTVVGDHCVIDGALVVADRVSYLKDD